MLRDRGVNARLAQCLNSVLNVKAVVAAFRDYEPSDGTFSSTNTYYLPNIKLDR